MVGPNRLKQGWEALRVLHPEGLRVWGLPALDAVLQVWLQDCKGGLIAIA